eukprot:jgi/Mesvir1/17520/Mv08773-RA.1
MSTQDSAGPSPDEVTLEQVLAVPDIGELVMGMLSIPERVRLRRTCRTFLAVADASLLTVTKVFGEDIAGEGCRPSKKGLAWLMGKCPNLATICVASRADHEEPWQERDRWPLAWRRVKYHEIDRGYFSLDKIAQLYRGLNYLNVASCLDVTDEGLVAIAASCQGLEGLDVSGCSKVSDRGVIAIAEACPGLLKLAVAKCDRVSDASLVALGNHCKRLEVIYADGAWVGDAGVIAVARGCSRLRRLAVDVRVTDDGLTQVAESCSQLEHLYVSMCAEVTDASITRVAEGCPRLSWLDISCCDVSDAGVEDIAANCPGLRRLVVTWTAVSDEGISAVANNCPQLEYLDMSQCSEVSDASLKEVVARCPRLKHLHVGECRAVTDASVCQLAETRPGLVELTMRETGVTAASIGAIGARCHDLRFLDIAGCKGGEALAALAEGCPKLEHLDMSSMGIVDERGMSALGRFCTKLRLVKADHNALSDRDVAGLIRERGRQLRVLDLSDSRGAITDRTVALVARACPRLEVFSVGSCQGVTDKGIEQLAKGCRELQVLHVEFCRGVTEMSLGLLDGRKCSISWQEQFWDSD